MKRKPLNPIIINPNTRTNFMDSCAFDPKYEPEDISAHEIFCLYEQGKFVLNIAHSNLKEIDHPNTPIWVKKEAEALIYTLPVDLTPEEIQLKQRILVILAGKGKPENMVKDAEHVFEASKYCGYFITTDKRILKKKSELNGIVSCFIVKPSEFIKIFIAKNNVHI